MLKNQEKPLGKAKLQKLHGTPRSTTFKRTKKKFGTPSSEVARGGEEDKLKFECLR
jgi:hypothetical protein